MGWGPRLNFKPVLEEGRTKEEEEKEKEEDKEVKEEDASKVCWFKDFSLTP